MTVLLDPTRRWECPSCGRQHVTDKPLSTIPLHPCRSQRGLLVPFVEVHGVELKKYTARHLVLEREDYVGSENVQTDGDGRPVMAVQTDRADGSNDCQTFAPCAPVEDSWAKRLFVANRTRRSSASNANA